MRRLIVAVLLLAAVAAAALWSAPRLIDDATLRERLAGLAAERLGRPVALAGPITLELLPEPRLEAADIAIGGDDDALGIRARGLRLRLDVAALLRGRIEPRELVIVGADLRLPWPPATLQSLRPPPWLTAFEARLEDSRIVVGAVPLEAVAMRVASGGGTAALEGEGRFAWRGRPVRFSLRLGRAGGDGAAPLDLALGIVGGEFSLSGILGPNGDFDGEVAARGADLAVFLPAPPGPFEARGRLTADADLVAIDPLSVTLGPQTARLAAALRLTPEPRLDVAVTAGFADLDGWAAALRAAPAPVLPVTLDLSAEAGRLGGIALRRVRGGLQFAAGRLVITDASALLPGETRVELAGASAGPRLELAVQASSPELRPLLAAFGLPPPPDPARLRRGEARFRLALEAAEASVTELEARIDDLRATGSGAWRPLPRPTLGLGLTFDRLPLDGLFGAPPALSRAVLAATDVNLRLAADRATWRGVAVERATLDAGLTGGRLTVRRLGLRLGGLDVIAGGTAELGADPIRLADLALEASGGSGPALAALLPAGARPVLPEAGQPALFRIGGSGTPDAIALRLEAELDALRLEATGTLDAVAGRAAGSATLRHPGAPRLLAPWIGADAAGWLGEGSLAAIAAFTAAGDRIGLEHLDLVAGTLRGQGRLALALAADRPSLTGRFAAERLPLPGIPGIVAFAGAGRPDIDLQITAERLAITGLPEIEAASGSLRLAEAGLDIELAAGRLGGGALAGTLALRPEAADAQPQATLRGTVTDAAIAGPIAGLPFDLAAGRFTASAALAASGRSVAAWRATLDGTAAVAVRDGVFAGLDLQAALAATGQAALPAVEAGLRDALAGGATAFEHATATAQFAAGRAAVDGAFAFADGATAAVTGTLDAARGAIDLRFTLRPMATAPPVALRASGPWAAPRRLPELAPYLRWRAERG